MTEIEKVQEEIDIIQSRISCLQFDIHQEEVKLYPLKIRLFELKEGVVIAKVIAKEFPKQGIDCSFPYPPMEV